MHEAKGRFFSQYAPGRSLMIMKLTYLFALGPAECIASFHRLAKEVTGETVADGWQHLVGSCACPGFLIPWGLRPYVCLLSKIQVRHSELWGGPKSPKSSQKQPPPPHRGRGGTPKSVKIISTLYSNGYKSECTPFSDKPRYYMISQTCCSMLWFYPPIQVLLQIQMFPSSALSAPRFFRCGTYRSRPTRLWRVSPWKAQQRGVGDWFWD